MKILLSILFIFNIHLLFAQKSERIVLDLREICEGISTAIKKGGGDIELTLWNNKYKETLKSVNVIPLLSDSELFNRLDNNESSNVTFTFLPEYIDSLAKGTNGYKLAKLLNQKFNKRKTIISKGDKDIVCLGNYSLKANSVAEFTMKTKGKTEIAVVGQPYARVNLKLIVNDIPQQRFDEYAGSGLSSRYEVIDKEGMYKLTIKVRNMDKINDINFVLITN